MVLGADDAIGLVALSLTCLHGCIKGLTVLSKARHYARDVTNVRLQIELSLQSLFTWAEEAGLTQDPPVLLVGASHASLVFEILGQLQRLLQDLNQLKDVYGLHLSTDRGNIDALDDEDSTLSKLGSKQHEYVERADMAIFRKRKEPWKRLRWVLLDDKKVSRLLEKINNFIGELEKFLEQSKQAKRDNYFELAYRDAIMNANSQQELQVLEQGYEQRAVALNVAIAAAARLKQTRLRLRLTEGPPSVPLALCDMSKQSQNMNGRPQSSRPSSSESSYLPLDSMRLAIRSLTLPRPARVPGLTRVLAYYNNHAVLLEWKIGPGLRDARILDRRVNQVAALLHGMEPSFHSLSCRGFVKDHEANRYGYVFDLPQDLSPQAASNSPSGQSHRQQVILPSLPEMHSLREMIDQSDRIPSLNSRLHISTVILEAILDLHTSGWLHKEFRSANIVLIRSAHSGESPWHLSSYVPYVAGYTYARADDPSELTEPLTPSTEADLYRHPSSLGNSRQPFCKRFDLFGVGCTLLEIGLWTSLRQILSHHASGTGQASARRVKGALQFSLRKAPEAPVLHDSSTPAATKGSRALNKNPSDGYSNKAERDATPDFMQLRHELISSPLGLEKTQVDVMNPMEPPKNPHMRSSILQSLEAAMGSSYTRIVEELISAALRTSGDASIDEHEFLLKLEVKAKDVIHAIAKVI